MPHLVDLLGRAHVPAGGHGQEHEPLVLAYRTLGEGARPAVLTGQPGREGQGRRIVAIDVKRLDPLPQGLLLGSHGNLSKWLNEVYQSSPSAGKSKGANQRAPRRAP